MSDVVPTSPIARLVAARSLNTFGRAIISTVVGWELYARTDSTFVLGLIGIVQVIPVVLLFVPVRWALRRVSEGMRHTGPRHAMAAVAVASP